MGTFVEEYYQKDDSDEENDQQIQAPLNTEMLSPEPNEMDEDVDPEGYNLELYKMLKMKDQEL
jgi:hypothetical protein